LSTSKSKRRLLARGFVPLLSLLLLSPILCMLAKMVYSDGDWFSSLAAAYTDPSRLLLLFGNSLHVTLGTVILSFSLGGPFGFLLARTNCFPRVVRNILVLITAALAVMPLYVSAAAWVATSHLALLQTPWAAAWIQGLAYAPLVACMSGFHFLHSDPSQEEAARLDGGWPRVIAAITLPAHRKALTLGALAIAVLSLTDITVTDIVRVRTWSEEIFTQFQRGAGPDQATAAALPLILLTGALLAWSLRLLRRGSPISLQGSYQQSHIIQLGNFRWVLWPILIAAALALWSLPLFHLVKAIQSPAQFFQALQATDREILGTLSTAPVAAILSALIAFPLARALCNSGSRWVLITVVSLLAFPAPLLGIGLIELFNQPGWLGHMYDSSAMIILAGLLRTLPFAVMIQYPALAAIPDEVQEAAILDGTTPWQKLRFIEFPNTRTAIALSALVAFILALGELGTTFLVAPPGQSTLSLRFFTLIHYGVYPDAASICLVLMGSVILAMLMGVALCRKFRERL
jgi:iron(III) transport system permease protein